jgi:hypothetical protein
MFFIDIEINDNIIKIYNKKFVEKFAKDVVDQDLKDC